MTTLVKKEIHLLLPGCCGVLVLEAVAPWLAREPEVMFSYTPLAFFLGLVLMSVDAFGREFTLGTFPSLMVQPIERAKIWRTKLMLLFVAAGLVSLAYAASCGARVCQVMSNPEIGWKAGVIRADYFQAMLVSGALLLVALTNGLWASLWLRQTTAAFWVTLSCPTVLAMLIALALPQGLAHGALTAVFCGLAVLYSLGSFWLARRLFQGAQDVGAANLAVPFARWRYLERLQQRSVSLRRHRPWAALLHKEFQLHSISLFCLGTLLAGHLCSLIVRIADGGSHENSIGNLVADRFWLFWLILPVLIGCTTVAEERKLGTLAGQFCLPVSRRRQFAAKVIPVLLAGLLLGGLVPWGLEIGAAHLGIRIQMLGTESQPAPISVVNNLGLLAAMTMAAMAMVGFGILTSSLTRSFVQAIGLAMGAGTLLAGLGVWLGREILPFTPTPALAAIVVFLPIVIRLLWRNFRSLEVDRRLWLHNLLSLAGAVVAVIILSAAVFFRAWELLGPLESAHSPAQLTLATAPEMTSHSETSVDLQWPDGRTAIYTLGYQAYQHPFVYSDAVWILLKPFPAMNGSGRLLDGSNWISVSPRHLEMRDHDTGKFVNGYLDTVGIRRDGTLWLAPASGTWEEKGLQQVGNETNWRQTVRINNNFVLLKSNGTLWWWELGTNTVNLFHNQWPTVQGTPLVQLGTNANWTELASVKWNHCLARKTDGTTWVVTPESITPPPAFSAEIYGAQLTGPGEPEIRTASAMINRAPYYDGVVFRTLTTDGQGSQAYIDNHGRLYFTRNSFSPSDTSATLAFRAVSSETNWQSATTGWDWLVALKRDGTLWKWNLGQGQDMTALLDLKPTQLGTHNDWVGLAESYRHPVGLAADGSLWAWAGTDHYDFALMQPPRGPSRLGNIFDHQP